MSFERIKKINDHEYCYPVKSIRLDEKVKQIFVKYLGKVDEGENIELQGCDMSDDQGVGGDKNVPGKKEHVRGDLYSTF